MCRFFFLSPDTEYCHLCALGINKQISLQDPNQRFKGEVMDLRLDIERRKRFAGKERDYRGSPVGSQGPSRERSFDKPVKHHKKSKYGKPVLLVFPMIVLSHEKCGGVVTVISDNYRLFNKDGQNENSPKGKSKRHKMPFGGRLRQRN